MAKEEKIIKEEKKSTPKENNSATIVLAVLIVGAVAFFGGMKFQNYKISKMRNNLAGQFRQGANFQGGQNRNAGNQARLNSGRPVVGEVVSMDDKSVTVKVLDGSSKIVILSDKTTFSKTGTGDKSDLKAGVQIGVSGTDNPDGSVTAQSIQLNPEFRLLNQTISPGPVK